MNYYYCKIVTLCVIVFTWIPSFSQVSSQYQVEFEDQSLLIEYFNTDGGLPHNAVSDVARDKKGDYWFATMGGLVKYDGFSFSTYNHQNANLATNKIHRLFIDEDSKIWLFHGPAFQREFGSVSIFDPITKLSVEVSKYLDDDFPIDLTSHFYGFKSNNEGFLLLDFKGRLLRYKSKTDYGEICNSPQLGVDLKEIPILTIIQETEDGYYFFSNQKHQVKFKEDCVITLVPNPIPNSYLFHIGGWLYVALEVENHAQENFLKYEGGELKKIENINFENTKGIRTENNWLYQKDKSQIGLKNFITGDSLVIGSDFNGEISFDRGKNIRRVIKIENTDWILTHSFGMFSVTPSPKKFTRFYTGKEHRGIAVTSNNELWFNVLDKPFDVEKKYDFSQLQYGVSVPLHLSSDGGLWKFVNDRILKYKALRLEDFEQKHVFENQSANEWYLCEDHNKRIWFFDHLSYYDIIADSMVVLEETKSPLYDYVRYFVQDDVGADCLWICNDDGLYRFDLSTMKFVKYNDSQKGDQYLPLKTAHHFHIDKNGIWWIATASNGLVKWDKKNNSHSVYNTKNGFPVNRVHAVYEDSNNRLWMNTEKGILKFVKSNGFSRIYTTTDGITHEEGNRASHFKASDGTLYFGSVAGVTSFKPNDIEDEFETDLELSISEITQPQKIDGYYQLVNTSNKFFENVEIVMSAGNRYAEIYLSPLSYPIKKDYIVRYKFNNEKDDWKVVKDNKIQISNIDYGRHTLLIETLSENDTYKKSLSIPIYTYKPIHQREWFIIGLLLFVGMLSLLALKLKTNYFRRQEDLLQSQVALGIKEIEKQKEAIIQQNKLLAEKSEKLREIDQLKTRFFNNVSHELRTPLTLIKGPVSSVMESEGLKQEDKKLLANAKNNINHLQSLISDLLDLSKMEAGFMPIKEVDFDIDELLISIVDKFKYAAAANGITLKYDNRSPDLIMLKTDIKKVENIVANFLSNAIKFTKQGGMVTLSLVSDANGVKVEVLDSGRGIKKEDLDKIFERYYRSESNKEEETGTGIGLSLCKEYSKLIGAECGVDSEYGIGSTFYLKIPIEKAVSKISKIENNVVPKAPDQNSITKNNNLRSLLIVEDNTELVEYLSYILKVDYNITIAKDGLEALSKLKSMKGYPDLIISDVMMPNMDGYELLEKLKEDANYQKIPIIMLTAKIESKLKLRALRIGVDDYMLKPFEEDELKVRIKNIIDKRAMLTKWLSEQNNIEPIVEEEVSTKELSGQEVLWLKDIEELVTKHVGDREFTVEKFASHMSLSRTQLFRRLKRSTGLSPNQYIREVRLQRAREILESKKAYSVKEVAFEVGITKTSYFTELYKKRFGKLPSSLLD